MWPYCTKVHEPEEGKPLTPNFFSKGLLGQNACHSGDYVEKQFVNCLVLLENRLEINKYEPNTLSGVTENSLYIPAQSSQFTLNSQIHPEILFSEV